MIINDYIRKVQYHETDKMGITHHSNYIKWMEEARIDFLEQIGFGYAQLEADGIISPVIGIDCRYKHHTTFDDTVRISVRIEEFKGVRLVIGYTMINDASKDIVLTGTSTHCFTDSSGHPIILKKSFPDFDTALKTMQSAGDAF